MCSVVVLIFALQTKVDNQRWGGLECSQTPQPTNELSDHFRWALYSLYKGFLVSGYGAGEITGPAKLVLRVEESFAAILQMV